MTDAVRVAAERQFGAELDWKRTEIAALQSQINPHFLYNTLESIRGQALWEGMDEVAEMTETLSLYFRYGISVKGNTVRLGDELRYVEHYVRIIKYRFGERFSFSIACEDEGLLDCTLPKLTIQPIIENAVRHGLEEKSGVGSVEVRISATEECLLVRVVDDGVGMGEEAIAALNARLRDPHPASEVELDDRRSGIALVNVNARIRLLYGEGYGVFPSSSLGSGTDVEIVLPLIRDLPGSLGGGL
jgi:two-component system sensor histidine kinase YesM